MTTRAVEQFDEWESSPFRDGYRGLHDLADGEFSGVVEAGVAKLCMLSGTVVGVLDGDIDDFEDAAGTAYEAPSPALPLLALMQERNDGVRGKYYSEDTPLSEVDDTLADGGFTGFVELSENVLSGDYYVVYHRGRSMAVAWVGNTGQLLTDDEAFDRADDEVGIFQVRPAEIDAIEVPEVESSDAGTGDAADAGGGTASAAQPKSGSGGGDAASEADETDLAPEGDGTATDAGGEAADAAEESGPAAGEPDGAVDEESTGATGAEASDAPESDRRAHASEPADDQPGGTTGQPPDDVGVGESPSGGGRDDTGGGRDDTGATAEGTETASPENAERSPDRRDDRSRTDDTDRDRTARTGAAEADPEPERTTETDRAPESGGRDSRRASDARSGEQSTGERTRDRSADARTDERATDARTDERATDARSDSPSAGADRTDAGESTGRAREDSGGRTDERTGSDGAEVAEGSASSPEQLATHTVPSLDPSRTTSTGSDEVSTDARSADPAAEPDPSPAPDRSANGPSDPPAERRRERSGRDESAGASASDLRSRQGSAPSERSDGATSGRSESPEADRASARVEDLEAELAEREATIEDLEADLAAAESEREELRDQLDSVRADRDDLQDRLERAESERDRLETERDSLESEVDDLESEVAQLESQIDEIEAEFGAAVGADRRLSPAEALDQTDLFVRYESKGKPTLETAHAGEASREEVGENLGLEYHTQFEREHVSVGGRPFDEFLRETMQFRFVDWVVDHLLYEIRDTGKVAQLQGLYDAIPRIDRAELNGTVATEYTEDGQERRSQESFDVVMRDRMGNALLTANMNDSRQAASESMMSTLVTASSHVGESTETLGASFLVTSSFFEPEALETASEATSGGLLSRDKRESFVKLSRKQGYHLCLVEAREDKFHLAVPEL